MAGAAAVEEKSKTETVKLWSKYPSFSLRNVVPAVFRVVINEHGHEERRNAVEEGLIQFVNGEADIDPKYMQAVKRKEGYGRDFWFLDELKAMYKDPKTRESAKGRCKERHRSMMLGAEKGREEQVPKELDMIMEIAGQ